MADTTNGVMTSAVKSNEQAFDVLDKMVSLAKPESVYGQPITAGDYTVITASEAWAGMGFGLGIGSGRGADDSGGEGGGGGGGGVSTGRPVAVVEVGPEGVYVQNVVDGTKIALAAIGALVSLIAARSRVRRAGRG